MQKSEDAGTGEKYGFTCHVPVSVKIALASRGRRRHIHLKNTPMEGSEEFSETSCTVENSRPYGGRYGDRQNEGEIDIQGKTGTPIKKCFREISNGSEECAWSSEG